MAILPSGRCPKGPGKVILSPYMERRSSILVLATVGLLLAASESRAGRIGLRMQAEPVFQTNRVALTTTLRNTGSETARDVSATILFAGRGIDIPSGWDIPPDEEASFTGELSPHLPSGSYPVVIRARYADSRGFEATAVKALSISTPDHVAPPLRASLGDARADGTDAAVLRLESTADTPVEARISLVTPEDVACPQPGRRVPVSPGVPVNVSFELENHGGLPGSRYRIYAIIEGEGRTGPWCLVADGRAEIPRHVNVLSRHIGATLLAAGACLLIFMGYQFSGRKRLPSAPPSGPVAVAYAAACLACLVVWTWFFFDHIPLSLLLKDTTIAGGDTVAHSYLASRLGESLFRHGRIASWADGWWCGFPMFQYYFCLPYLATAILDLILPFNVAFKLVSVVGLLMLPVCAFVCARALRMPRPGPLLVAIATVPFLFDHSHTMWGVNVYSTLAGMISNSVSFSIMLLAIGAAARDADDGRVRLQTAIVFALLVASHFFTSIMAALAIAALPLLTPKAGFLRALRTLAQEAALAGLLMAWWLIPLIAKRSFAVDFGENWDVSLIDRIPDAALAALPFALVALAACSRCGVRFVALMAWMAACALFLFYAGFGLSPVFVNVRLWPFLTFSLMALGAAGLAAIIGERRGLPWAVTAVLLCAISIGVEKPNSVREWADWNYSGLETSPRYPVFERLVLPLDGTPGRLANDLHDDNNALGSSRVFECVPHLIDKGILEGGIVNSAAGSLYAYYIQGETSDSCAGFPPIVTPTTFNITNATAHLELFNVKHFIARSDRTQAAMTKHPAWTPLAREQGWSLFELTTHAGRHVSVCAAPVAIRAPNWKQASLDWLYDARLLEHPVVFLQDGQAPPPGIPVLAQPEFAAWRDDCAQQPPTGSRPLQANFVPVVDEHVSSHLIRFKTEAPGIPHVIRHTYFPNWKVRGADDVYMVSPCFMLVVPDTQEVELYYGYTLSDTVGRILTVLGIVCLIAVPVMRCRRNRAKGTGYVVQSQRAS
jgi:hypothetical protein